MICFGRTRNSLGRSLLKLFVFASERRTPFGQPHRMIIISSARSVSTYRRTTSSGYVYWKPLRPWFFGILACPVFLFVVVRARAMNSTATENLSCSNHNDPEEEVTKSRTLLVCRKFKGQLLWYLTSTNWNKSNCKLYQYIRVIGAQSPNCQSTAGRDSSTNIKLIRNKEREIANFSLTLFNWINGAPFPMHFPAHLTNCCAIVLRNAVRVQTHLQGWLIADHQRQL